MPAHGRNPIPRALGGEIFLGENLARFDFPGGHNALAGNGLVGGFAGGQVLVAVAEGGFCVAHGQHHRRKLGGVQAGLLVGAGQGFVQRKVLFNDLCAQNRRGYVAFPAGRMVGQPYRQTELVVQLDHGGQVCVLVGRRVLRVAVQNRHLGTAAVIHAFFEVYPSTACVKASSPGAAVTDLGLVSVNV